MHPRGRHGAGRGRLKPVAPLQWWLSQAGELLAPGRWTLPELWLLLRWAGQNLLETGAVIAADALAGAVLLARIRPRLPVRLRGAVALTLGGGLSGMLIFGLGLFGWIYPSSILCLTLLAALSGLWLLVTRRGRWHAGGWLLALRPRGGWLLLALLLFSLQTLEWLMPVLDFDSGLYHAASARWYQQTHQLAYHSGIRFHAQPHLPALLYLRQLELFDDQRIKLINLEFALALVLAVAHVAHRCRVPAPLALGLVGLSPVFWWMSRTEYADFAMAAWFAVGAALLLERRPRPALGGLALGLAGASKVQGLLMAALFGSCYVLGRRRWREAVPLAAAAILCGLPWWLRSWRHTGSPLYPFFTDSPDTAALFQVSARYGLGRDWLAFLRLPWDAFVGDYRVFADPYPFGPALLLLAAAVAGAVLGRRSLVGLAVPLAAFSFYLGFWFRTGQVMRYLAAWLPVIAMMIVLALRHWCGVRARLAPLAVALGATGASLWSLTVIRVASLPPVRMADRESLLAAQLPHYAAVRELNRVRQPDERTYLLFCEDARYHVDGPSYGDWFGEYRYGWAGNAATTPAELVARLRSAGFDYLLVDRIRARTGGQLYSAEFRRSGLVETGQPLPEGLQLIYTDGRHVLCKIR